MTLKKTAYKTEIIVTTAQAEKLRQTIGVSRFIYNLFIAHNKAQHEQGLPYVSGMSFSKYLNTQYRTEQPEHSWIQAVSSKSTKQAIMNADLAFKDFFAKKKSFPQFKKKAQQSVKAYFPLNNPTDIICERHRLKIPTIGWVQLKEKGYLPTEKVVIKSVTVSQKADRFYASLLVEEEPKWAIGQMTLQEWEMIPYSEGVGIDLGIKELAILSNGMRVPNINHTKKVKHLERRLKLAQRKLSKLQDQALIKDKIEKDQLWSRKNYQKQKIKVQRLHQKLTHIRDAHIQQAVTQLVKTKPAYVTLEDLNIKGMMKNRHLSKAIQQQKWYTFKLKLIQTCHKLGIEVRQVDRFYPSSKLCHHCQVKHVVLRLKDREWQCQHCLKMNDRDWNACLNLRDSTAYVVIAPPKPKAVKSARYGKKKRQTVVAETVGS